MSEHTRAGAPSRQISRRLFLSSALAATASLLAGCAASEVASEQVDVTEEELVEPVEPTEPEPEVPVSEETVTEEPEEAPFSSVHRLDDLTDIQLNSINMLNYLAVLMREINESKNSRLLMEDIYSGLLNNTSPNAVDEITLYQLETILDTLEDYRMLGVKRERLRTIYERAQADALTQALPDPLSLLSLVQSRGLADLAFSLVYMAVDSVASYSSAMSEAESQYLQDGWALDDEESEVVHSSRTDTFYYMVETVTEYGLPGDLSLTEETVDEFVEWKSAEVASRIRFLEDRSDTYCALGAYWLLLAESYHEHGDWEKCVRAIDVYESLSTNILRRDHPYAKALTLAVSAAGNLADGNYAERAKRWADAILSNCSTDDWAQRYFAAQVYVGLYRETGDVRHIIAAFETALNNANELLRTQRNMNDEFLSPIKLLDGGPGPFGFSNPFASDAEKKKVEEIGSYNKMLEEERKAELPPIYGPLVANLELMRAIVDEGFVGEEALSSADEILHGSGELFLVSGLDARYTFTDSPSLPTTEGVVINHNELSIPASLVTNETKLEVKVSGGNGNATFEDWQLSRVDRMSEERVEDMTAMFKSSAAEGYNYVAGQTVTVTIDPMPSKNLEKISASFTTIQSKSMPWEHVMFWDDGIRFVTS